MQSKYERRSHRYEQEQRPRRQARQQPSSAGHHLIPQPARNLIQPAEQPPRLLAVNDLHTYLVLRDHGLREGLVSKWCQNHNVE